MNAIAIIGRPSSFSQALADQACEIIADGGSLEDIRSRLGVSSSTLARWLDFDDTFRGNYANAKLLKADSLADAVVPLADSALGKDSAGVQAIKTMVDARKWAAAKYNPHTYGDKLDVTSKGEALAAPSHQVDARVKTMGAG